MTHKPVTTLTAQGAPLPTKMDVGHLGHVAKGIDHDD